MDTAQQRIQAIQQTETLIDEMLGFLDSTSEDGEDKEAVDYLDEVQFATMTLQEQKTYKELNPIVTELSKINIQFSIFNTERLVPNKKLPDPFTKSRDPAETDNWSSKLESNCRRSINSYVQEVNRAIYGDTTDHPSNGSAEYFEAAQKYAIYGKDFLDFPENLTPLVSEKSVVGSANTSPEVTTIVDNHVNELHITPAAAPEIATSAIPFINYGKQSAVGSATPCTAAAATYYAQICNGMQQRPTACTTAYGMFLGNKVTYVATAPTAPTLVFNQHTSTTTNFISNSLANAALASTPAILYSNPMLTTTTQQYLNTFFKETQYLSGGSGQATTGIYERLVYAQMLQQQIFHQTQQQAAAVAAMFQHHKPPRPVARTAVNGGTQINTSASMPTVVAASTAMSAGLNLCGRQVTIAAAGALPEILTKHQSVTSSAVTLLTNGADDIMPTITALGD